jgi:hypothetical protein
MKTPAALTGSRAFLMSLNNVFMSLLVLDQWLMSSPFEQEEVVVSVKSCSLPEVERKSGRAITPARPCI